jgi:hypothetical protein
MICGFVFSNKEMNNITMTETGVIFPTTPQTPTHKRKSEPIRIKTAVDLY